jgi:outer membrane receptor for ferrienterochelin and colicin
MESTFNFNIPLTINELAAILKKQLPTQDRQTLVHLLQDEQEVSMSQLKSEIRQAVVEMNLIKKGKLKARPVQDLLDEL